VGVTGPDIAVADAGPLIHLAEIGCLSAMAVFGALHIPNAVWSETVEAGRVRGADISGLDNIHRHALPGEQVSRFVADHGLQRLHAGERECLYLCQQHSVSILLTDDMAVRDAARHLSLTPVGSLGVVVRAYRRGRFSLADAEQYLERLYDVSTLYVTRAIVELAIQQLRGS
jgi:predicted nucleic acid-binding protein